MFLEHGMCRQRPGAAGFEDGTPAYLGISALKHGFTQIERFGGFPAIERHTASLTRYCCPIREACTVFKLLSNTDKFQDYVKSVLGADIKASSIDRQLVQPIVTAPLKIPMLRANKHLVTSLMGAL